MNDSSTFQTGKQAPGVILSSYHNSADEVILHHCKNKQINTMKTKRKILFHFFHLKLQMNNVPLPWDLMSVK